ncbi:aspartate aminotransferase family protein [Candidatus Bathyarchaeota archaeon]|nr:aspartate aminotransferase family protein [Candidatus Bathyarchaeota archaeon]
MWTSYVKKYVEKTPGSKRLYERAARLIPGGISHNIRFYPPYPLYTVKAKGSRLWDVDGNVYTDYWMAHMVLILGHSPEPVLEFVRNQVENGTHLGTVNPYAVELAEAIIRNVPCAEMVRIGCSGTEATMYAVRLARAYTGRRVVVKAEGGWHGGNPILHKAVSPPYGKPESLGILEEEQKYTRVMPVNDIEGTEEVLKECRRDLACVIVEPVLGGGCIPLDRDYLVYLREVCDEYGAVLIFDEVITGFRLGLSGGQGFYRVTPDMATFGKIIGGGFPIGAVAGRADILKLADPVSGKPKWKRCWTGGGTFSGNPISTGAGLATIRFLEKHADEVYGKINKLGEMARTGIDKALEGLKGLKAKTTGVGSLLLTHFLKEGEDVRSSRDRLKTDQETQVNFYIALMNYGIFFLPGHTGSISYAHSEEDIKMLIEAVEKIAEDTS